MTDKAATCIRWMLGREGGYVHDPPDPETYRGISRVAHPDWDGWAEIDRQKPKRGQVYQDLEPRVLDFYAARYWTPELEAMPEALALVCLDFSVNSGAAWQIIHGLRLKLDRDPMPREVIRARGHYMVDLACGFVLADERKVRYWTEVLPGWMRRLRDNLRIVRTMEG